MKELQDFEQMLTPDSEGKDIYHLLQIYDAIEFRSLDVELWITQGLTEDDEVPVHKNKLIIPSFNMIEDK